MTKEEAIEVLRTIEVCSFKDKSKKYFFKDVTDALDMAIKALEQQPCETIHGSTYGGVSWGGTYKPQQPCEDCISRTALLSRIDAERKHLLDIKMDGAEHVIVHHARRIIEDMPSVTPKARWIPMSEQYKNKQSNYNKQPLPQPYAESEDKK